VPPVPAPRLLAADPDAGVLVVTRVPGVPVSADRYPGPLPGPTAAMVLQTAAALASWRPPAGLFAPVFDYPDRFSRYQRLGLLADDDVAALTTLSAVAGAQQVAHGDLLPANILRQPAGDPAEAATVTGVLDWEFTGLFLPAFDLALLWVALAATPEARPRIEAAVGVDPDQLAGFWVNVAMVATRELRTHAELPPGPLRETRLAARAATWAHARDQLHAAARRP
jgi:Phosphotransferase enzyme family